MAPTTYRGVYRLMYCLGQLAQLPTKEDGTQVYYLPGYLRKFTPDHWEEFCSRPVSRRASRAQLHRDTCLVCDRPISDNSIGDHLIPTSLGGKNSPDNWLALCRSHNSSKGGKDFIQWWCQHREHPLHLCPPRILLQYTRLAYEHGNSAGSLDNPAPAYLIAAVQGNLDQYSDQDALAILASSGFELTQSDGRNVLEEAILNPGPLKL